MVLRGLRRRCPNCGDGGTFESWIRLRAACRGCGLRLDRGEDDFFLGAYTVNFVTSELLLALFVVLFIVVRWPAVPWNAVLWGAVALMVAAPIAFFPFSRTLWLAIDLSFRPATARDFTDDGPDSAPDTVRDAPHVVR